MRRPRFLPSLALLVALASGSVACHRPDSFLLIEVASDLRLMPQQFTVGVSVGRSNETKYFHIPKTPAPEPIPLPTSFSIQLDRAITGPVTVFVDASDSSGALLGMGFTTQDHIKVGDDTIIVVWVTPGEGIIPGDPDAGVSDDAGGGEPDTGTTDDGGGPDAGVPDGGGDPDADSDDAASDT